jgi:D-amino peptidase
MNRLLLFWLAIASCHAQGPKIFIVTDMEGVGGVNNADEQLLPSQRRYEETRRLLTGEVNAAAAGAFEGGASEVVIWDGHDSSRSLSIDEIHPRARLIQGPVTPPDYYLAEKLYDGIMFVGQHPMAGTKGGVLAHSESFSVQNIFLNGRPVGEIGEIAAIAGYFDIPLIMLAGDEAACQELLAIQPKAETVAVKRLVGRSSTLSLSHAEARALIQAAASRAVTRIREFAAWKIEGPVEVKIEYFPQAPGVSSAALSRDGKRVIPRSEIYSGRTVLEAFQHWMGN